MLDNTQPKNLIQIVSSLLADVAAGKEASLFTVTELNDPEVSKWQP